MFDPTLLTTFVAVAQAASFSEAGRRLNLRQSTVSQHVRRLEETAGRRLFVRDTHSVTLTADGEAMLALAGGILEANERARQYFAGSELRGQIRFGAAEDFVESRLPEVLRDFTRLHRSVDIELTVNLSARLFQALDAGELDLVLAKRRPGEERGRLVRRVRLVWITADPALADPLPAAEHQPRRRAGGARAGKPAVAHRLYQHQPQRPPCGSTGRPRHLRPVRGLCAGRVVGGAAIGSASRTWLDRVCRRRQRAHATRPGTHIGRRHTRQRRQAVGSANHNSAARDCRRWVRHSVPGNSLDAPRPAREA
jgi:DNA-binding transcriptional LysR family regulator